MEGVILAFLEIKLSLHITMRTALNMSENATRSFWCQAVVSILSRSTCPNRFAIKHTQLYSPISTGVDRAIARSDHCSDIVEQLPRGKAYLADQLQRAGTSVPLNIAEGAGEDAINEKARFYRMARRSATECSSIFDVCQRLGLLDKSRYAQGRILLLRIVAMLTKMGRAETAYTSPR